MHSRKPVRWAVGASAAAAALILTGCTVGAATTDGSKLSVYIDSDPSSVALWDGLVAGYAEANPDVTVTVETHPSGGEADNLIKTRLSTGDMNDLFWYNSGSLFQALSPDKTLTPLSDEEWVDSITENFKTVVSTDSGLYGAPVGASFAGAIIYNKDIYAQLGLEIPTTWDEFTANNEKIKAAGITPIIPSALAR
jgi:raffinose/stachyose/melibiose transport system substrate-binding protein